jgi:cupin superfamily acireductone dioxygenase involved in methionine salvage
MAMQEEHIMDIALSGENYCSAIHRQQHYFVAGALVRMRGARMFTTDDSWINAKGRHVPLL